MKKNQSKKSMPTNEAFEQHLKVYIDGVQALMDADNKTYGTYGTLGHRHAARVVRGRRYVRVIADWVDHITGKIDGEHLHTTVDQNNGDVLGGWTREKSVIGNVFDPKNGLDRIDFYGPKR